jgi:Phytanoyl-CoA dioxygenase (PhyH)
MHVIPGSHRQLPELLPRLIRDGLWSGRSGIRDIREVPEFAVPVPTTAKAGSALFYSSYLIHAAVPFRNKRKQRAFWTLSMARADNSAWTRLANPWTFSEREFIIPFWSRTTPRVRTLFGWPPPGHPYYTRQTVDFLATWFPGMDLSAYRQ